MTKRRSKIAKAFLTLALTASLSLGSLLSASAAGNPITGGTPANPLEAAINKTLQMPAGTPTPATIFKFDVTSVTVDGVTATTTNMPVITTQNITFAATDTGTTTAGIKTVSIDSADIFTGVTWPHAGVYEYKITEQANTYTTSTGETMTYSAGEYKIVAYVENDPATNTCFIASISASITTQDTTGQTIGDKVDPSPGDPVLGTYSALVFTNQYTKNNGGPNPITDSVLQISKTVAGAMGNQAKYFDFKVTLTAPSPLVPATTTYKVYVIDTISGTPAVVSPLTSANYGGTIQNDGTYDYIELTSSTAETIHLKHSQYLSFTDAHVGTTYVAEEAADTAYTPSIALDVDGTPSSIPGTINTALSTGTVTIGSTTNSAAFTNTSQTITPTGISLNNLPFIMMLVAAVAALITFVAIKSRKRA